MLGKTEGRRRRGWQSMRWLDGIIDLMYWSLSKLWEIMKDREALGAAVHRIAKNRTGLSHWTELNWTWIVEHGNRLERYTSLAWTTLLSAWPSELFFGQSVLVTQSCPTLCNPIDCSPPGFFVHGILQARTLEWVVIPFSMDFPDRVMEPTSPSLQDDSLLSEWLRTCWHQLPRSSF